jgi:hypothetical protein
MTEVAGGAEFFHQEVSMFIHKSRLAVTGFVLAVMLGTGEAYAADAKQIADAFVALVTAEGKTTASYDSATASGDDVTITNFKMSGEGNELTVPSILITGAQPRDKGGFTAASMSMDGGKMTTEDKSDVAWQSLKAEGVTIPSADEVKAKAHITPFNGMAIGNLTISGGELKAPVTIASADGKVAVDDKGSPTDFTGHLVSLKIPLELIEDDQRQIVQSLGYTEPFEINMTVDGGYKTATDELDFRSFVIDTTNVGKISLGGKFLGIPLSKLTDEQKAKEIAATGKLDSFSIRFDNAGIVEKLLDMQAKQSGMSTQDFVTQITGGLPFMLNFIGNEAFQKKVADAATAFLNDPKSITLSVKPSAPVAFVQIMGAGQSAPQTLPDLLGADVQANN